MYIQLSPVQLAAHIALSLQRPTTPLAVATFFTSPCVTESRALAAYARRYRCEIDEILRLDVDRVDRISAPGSPRHRRTESAA